MSVWEYNLSFIFSSFLRLRRYVITEYSCDDVINQQLYFLLNFAKMQSDQSVTHDTNGVWCMHSGAGLSFVDFMDAQ